MNVDAMLRSLTAKQFAEWEHYARLEPFNETRADYRAASIREMVFNMAVTAKDRKPLDYFLLKFGEQEPVAAPVQSVDEQILALNMLAMISQASGD